MHALCHVLVSVKTFSKCYTLGVVKLEGRQLKCVESQYQKIYSVYTNGKVMYVAH